MAFQDQSTIPKVTFIEIGVYENALGLLKLYYGLNQYMCNKQTVVCFQMHFYLANEYNCKFILLLYYNSSTGKN